jgi:hypothetical protein
MVWRASATLKAAQHHGEHHEVSRGPCAPPQRLSLVVRSVQRSGEAARDDKRISMVPATELSQNADGAGYSRLRKQLQSWSDARDMRLLRNCPCKKM